MSNNQHIDAVAQSVVADAVHYVGAVSELADKSDVCAVKDIMSSTGIKLVASGARIDSSLREKLCGHRLAGTTLDEALCVTGGVSPESLGVDMGRLINKISWFKRLARLSGDPVASRHCVSRLDLPREILFRLTVARDQRPELYHHLLSVAITSHFIALRLQLQQASIDSAVAAGLCHDLGELYVSPEILNRGHRITDEERRYIYVHPIIGWIIVCGLLGSHSEVSSGIIQHHERLDGSGYPYGIGGEAIGMTGRILAVADVSASIMARFGDHQRLSTLLRLNGDKYDPKVVGLLYQGINKDLPETARVDRGALMKRLTCFAAVFKAWARLRAETGIAQVPSGVFVAERMFSLRTAMIQFGFDPDSIEMLMKLAEEDEPIAAELTAAMDELQFQLDDLRHEYDRRAEELMSSLNPLAGAVLADWRQQLDNGFGN